MKGKLLFIVKAISLSVVLFVLWSRIERFYISMVAAVVNPLMGLFSARAPGMYTESFYLLIPALSLLIVARGLTLKYRLKWVAVGIISFILFDVITVSTNIVQIARQYRLGGGLSAASTYIVLIYWTFVSTLPFLFLLIALKGKFERLWIPLDSVISSKACPICGKRRTGLAQHIRSVHGLDPPTTATPKKTQRKSAAFVRMRRRMD